MGDGPRIVVVGTSGAGKSTLVRLLEARDYDAYAVAQEHSVVPTLWRRRAPDFLVYLECSYEALAQRRPGSRRWDWLTAERRRLAHARNHADICITTDGLDPAGVLQRVEAEIHRWHAGESGGDPC